jgi:flagellar protein FlaF
VYANQVVAYKNAQQATMSSREIEAAALTKTALRLKECQKNWDSENRYDQLNQALKANQMIWSIFQSELTNKNNPLPKQVKEDILSLSLFVDRQIIEVMAYPTPEKLNILININMNIASGLRGN